MSEITCQLPGAKRKTETKSDFGQRYSEELVSGVVVKPEMSANRIAARVMQLRMKGKHEEADNLLAQRCAQESQSTTQEGNTRRNIMHGRTARQKKNDEDADLYFANAIIRNKFSIDGLEDDACDHDDSSRKKSRKGGSNHGSGVKTNFAHRILTQQERCQFCFENPTRPPNLIISIANFVYLMLPPWQPVVPGHCCILPLHHEVSTRNVENNIWDEIRNFKKCLIRMFANQEKEVVFIETVMGLAHQQCHCLIECIPLPNAIAKQAPLYFKKAIDDAEDEWSQHDAKKLIDTSVKGLRSSIPKDFPYFHVEFGLSKGFAHVIDDDTKFKSNFGLNVIRGMLKLPAEDLHRPKKQEAVNLQIEAVCSFIKEWEPYDWVRQLD
ncbi:Zinc finger CCCH domain-containing protein 59 [Heracleum sosnowskyi]|uniref:Zinc finger CCCH domain-containing protein 59 n=1 Tax=Heracleum sosnowskyi TaxID=360622 RepID=A0AAD8J755_9APIA|nr:Zinc finger CCCH domain-containing protein 59 [Heracleum sosnowskyi]